jgi:hypothetical protein
MNACHYTEGIFIVLFVKVNGNGSNPTWASLVDCVLVCALWEAVWSVQGD